MNIANEIARHIREIHSGVNWTQVNMKEVLSDIHYEEAIERPVSENSIAVLVYHMNFYLNIVHERLKGGGLVFNHEDSFIISSIQSEDDWQKLIGKTFADAENFAQRIERFPEGKLFDEISAETGSYYKNMHGVAEHNHYHLGQIVLLKKIIRQL
jgi:hypothetical protein